MPRSKQIREKRSQGGPGSRKHGIERGESFIPPTATRPRQTPAAGPNFGFKPELLTKKLSSEQLITLSDTLPPTPAPPKDFLKHVSGNPQTPVRQLLKPFLEYENVLRGYLAQKPDHEFVADNTVNLVDVFGDENEPVLIRGRDLGEETQVEKDRYLMELKEDERKKNGAPALVGSLEEFKGNFGIFSEGCLANMDWSNIVVAGSAVITPMLPVPGEFKESRRALRGYYHDQLAPASDIDLFIYGLETDEEGIKRMEEVERTIKDNLLWETTAIRTRNTVTIVSQYPNRHVQIVLRLYKSISQILTGFDVNCSCFAYDGTRVLASPRALAACITQCNDIDVRRRSPSYENRLAKYSHKRGFEVWFEQMDRSRIDPTIYEQSFARLTGLARLLVLEALPNQDEREAYQERRRKEMGRPEKPRNTINYRDDKDKKHGGVNMEVPEWEDFEDISGYQKFSIPYGEGFHAKKLEKMFFKKDLMLNAEWNEANRPPHRNVHLHRHPVFIGDVKDVVADCCGFCPVPTTAEELEIVKVEDEIYVRGPLHFLHYREADAGRQEVGSFFPLNPEEFCARSYVGATEKLCQAIVDDDLEFVESWVVQEGVDLNARDYCGRTPLHLAIMATSARAKIAKTLIDHGARLVARLQDGRTALHLAAARGSVEIVDALMKKSEENKAERDEIIERKEKEKLKLAQEEAEAKMQNLDVGEDGDVEMKDVDAGMSIQAEPSVIETEKDNDENTTELDEDDFSSIHMSDAGSLVHPSGPESVNTEGFINVEADVAANVDTEEDASPEADKADLDEEGDDIFDVNVEDWDWGMTPLHHAVICNHIAVVETLTTNWVADPRKPIKNFTYNWKGKRVASGAVMTLVHALSIPKPEDRATMVRKLLKVGASCGQSTILNYGKISAFQYFVQHEEIELLKVLFEEDGPVALNVLNRVYVNVQYSNMSGTTPLISAMMAATEDHSKLSVAEYLLSQGARAKVTLQDVSRSLTKDSRQQMSHWKKPDLCLMRMFKQPIQLAITHKLPADFLIKLIEAGADVDTLDTEKLPNNFGQWDYYLEFPVNGGSMLDFCNDRIHVCNEFLRKHAEREAKDAEIGDEEAVLDELERAYIGGHNHQPKRIFMESVLDQFSSGSFLRFAAEKHLKDLNSQRKHAVETAEKERLKRREENVEHRRNKEVQKQKVQGELALFQKYQDILVQNGAKTYHQLYPEKYKQWLAQEKERKEAEEAAWRQKEEWARRFNPGRTAASPMTTEEEEEEEEGGKKKKKKEEEFDMELGLRFKRNNNTEFGTRLGSVNDNTHKPEEEKQFWKAHVKLFEAAWNGDEATMRAVTCGITEDENGEKLPPVLVSISEDRGRWDETNHNVLTLAVIRGHFHLIDVILEIAKKQYKEPEGNQIARPSGFEIDKETSDESEGEDSESEIGRVRKFDDGDFVENHEEVEVVEERWAMPTCATSPFGLLMNTTMRANGWFEETWAGWDKWEAATKNDESTTEQYTALSYAILRDDVDLVRRLLALANKYFQDCANGYRQADEEVSPTEGARRWLGLESPDADGSPSYNVALAIRLGRIAILEEIMRSTSFGIWYSSFEDPDEEQQRKHAQKYYQGLTIRGGKNKAWINSASPANSDDINERGIKPLHVAAHGANIVSYEWLISDRPWELLLQFKAANAGTKEVRILETFTIDKLHSYFTKALGLNTSLLPHLCLIGWRPSSATFLTHIVNKDPTYLNTRNETGLTPALFAIRSAPIEAIKTLLSLSADFSTRDKHGRNILHLLLCPVSTHTPITRPELIRATKILSLLPLRLLKEATTQRTLGLQRTPLSHYLAQTTTESNRDYYSFPSFPLQYPIRALLLNSSFSTGTELRIPDASGNTPIHTAFLRDHWELAHYLLSTHDPTAIHAENANGRTPYEIAQGMWWTQITKEGAKEVKRDPGNVAMMYHTDDDIWQQFNTRSKVQEKREKREREAEERKKPRLDRWRTGKEEMWKVAVELAGAVERGGGDVDVVMESTGSTENVWRGVRRKLAGLADANELARRIQNGVVEMDTEYEDKGDVASLWASWRRVRCEGCDEWLNEEDEMEIVARVEGV